MSDVLRFVAGALLAALALGVVGQMVWEAATKPDPYWRGWRSARLMTWRCVWMAAMGVLFAWPVFLYVAVPLAALNGWLWWAWRRRGDGRDPLR